MTIRVPLKAEYDPYAQRWLSTYTEFMPETKHQLVVVDSDSPSAPGPYEHLASLFLVYYGGGWDCGTWQFVGRHVNTDLLICCNTSTYFCRKGWMERIIYEVEKYGIGLYGSMGSFESYKHLRTPCMAFQPCVIADYPIVVDSRKRTFQFECHFGTYNFTQWCASKGYTPRLVTWDGCYEMEQWRTTPNVFRKGDQSNIIVKDRHVDEYDKATSEEKARLTGIADGIIPPSEQTQQTCSMSSNTNVSPT